VFNQELEAGKRRVSLPDHVPAVCHPLSLNVLWFQSRFLLPFFCGAFAAMCLGAYIASKFLFLPQELPVVFLPPEPSLAPAIEISSAFLQEPELVVDEVMVYYANPESREWVIAFFARVCGSAEIAAVILEGAARYAISPSLAFALCWEESRYNYLAVNRRNRDGSIDRGLFQLNSNSFPRMNEQEFFSPRINTHYGMAHLRLCFDAGGTEIAALAMYNAGIGRVRSSGTPRQTLDYVARILSSRRKIEQAFREVHARSLAAGGFSAPEPAAPAPVGIADTGEAGETGTGLFPGEPAEIAALGAFRPIPLYPLSR
jgi:hypothetical protein